MPRKSTSNPLAERMDALGIDCNELSDILCRRYTPDEIMDWCAGSAEPDAEAKIRLRILDEDSAALRAVERVRSKRTRNLRSEDWQTADVDVPYGGGFAGIDAGAAQ